MGNKELVVHLGHKKYKLKYFFNDFSLALEEAKTLCRRRLFPGSTLADQFALLLSQLQGQLSTDLTNSQCPQNAKPRQKKNQQFLRV